MIDQTILPYLSQIDAVSDVQVRKAAVEILVDMGCVCMGSWFLEILDDIEKVCDLLYVRLLLEYCKIREPELLLTVKFCPMLYMYANILIYFYYTTHFFYFIQFSYFENCWNCALKMEFSLFHFTHTGKYTKLEK